MRRDGVGANVYGMVTIATCGRITVKVGDDGVLSYDRNTYGGTEKCAHSDNRESRVVAIYRVRVVMPVVSVVHHTVFRHLNYTININIYIPYYIIIFVCFIANHEGSL